MLAFPPGRMSVGSTMSSEVFGGRRMKVAIVGGSIGGLSAATVLHRLGCEVKVFEKSATPFKG